MTSHSLLMMLLSKLAPQSLRSLADALKIKMYPYHKNLATVFAVSSGVTYAITCLVKWSQKTKTFTMCGGWSTSIDASLLVKSTWRSSKGGAIRIVCSRALQWAPLWWIHLSQLLITSLYPHCHARPPELILQQGQCLLLTLMPSVPMESIYGHNSLSHGDYKLHHFFQLSSCSMTVIEGTLVECEFIPFPKDCHTLFCSGMVP